MIAPNIPKPTANDAAAAALKVRSRNSDTGTIGLSARRSWKASSARTAKPTANRAIISPEPPADWSPARTVPSSTHETPAASRPAPV